jgi:hypothetical protein
MWVMTGHGVVGTASDVSRRRPSPSLASIREGLVGWAAGVAILGTIADAGMRCRGGVLCRHRRSGGRRKGLYWRHVVRRESRRDDLGRALGERWCRPDSCAGCRVTRGRVLGFSRRKASRSPHQRIYYGDISGENGQVLQI